MRFSDALNHPGDGVVIERLRTEATLWVKAVALQVARINRQYRKHYLQPVEAEVIEVDLHFFLVALVRHRRCVEHVGRCVPYLRSALDRRVQTFDASVPSLRKLRNVGEHIDDYNLDKGRDKSVNRRHVQTWNTEESASGILVWEWLGERLDVEDAYQAAVVLFRGFVADCEAWIERSH